MNKKEIKEALKIGDNKIVVTEGSNTFYFWYCLANKKYKFHERGIDTNTTLTDIEKCLNSEYVKNIRIESLE